MLLDDLVATSRHVTATRSRLAKRSALAELLGRAAPEDVVIVVAYLSGELRQRRTGVGWSTLRNLPDPAESSTLTLQEVDAELQRISELSGSGSSADRARGVQELFGRASRESQSFLRSLISGEIRQGALDSAMLDAVAEASGVPLGDIRTATMLRGATGPVAVAALNGGRDAVLAFTLSVGQPIRPMLASTAPDVLAALDKLGPTRASSVDIKIDGIRMQLHKDGDAVSLFTRSLDDITNRLPEVVAMARAFPAERVILDGEAISLDTAGRPRPFQETASRTASQVDETRVGTVVTPYFFDCLHVDGEDLIDLPLSDRLTRLDEVVPAPHVVGRLTGATADEAQQFFLDAVGAGHEGVVVKALDAPYEAGRRGAGWVKVKPRHTLDLVVLAVEWGSGRRQGWLSNIHLGARDPEGGGFVMLGKTFKGMTDEMLAWQTQRFQQLEVSRTASVVTVRPEQVVEVAFDGVQTSRRYPGGVALRFARVLRYRDDKTASEADTIDQVRRVATPS